LPLVAIGAVLAVGVGLALYFRGSPAAFGYWFPFPFFPLLFIPLVLLFFGFRWFFWGGAWGCGWYGSSAYDPAMEALRERYARGELSRDQFQEMSRNLRYSPERAQQSTPEVREV
jgi:putative membrane protein